jgi:hypothetical protein
MLAAFVACTVISCSYLPFRKSREDVDLSREAFIKEMVIASKTKATKYFDDYTPGSYHVAKLDLIKGARSLIDSTTRDVVAVIVLGPSGPLWQYDVITVIDSVGPEEQISVNRLAFAHARVVLKSTKQVEREDYLRMKSTILSNPLLEEASDEDWDGDTENSLSAVIATLGEPVNVLVLRGETVDVGGMSYESLIESVNELIGGKDARVTYD